ncbi:hypothetical protein GCM10028820_24330 [Tessaracoccus terricola]
MLGYGVRRAWRALYPARALYDVFQLALLISVSVLTVSRWGVFGVLGTAMVSVIWLLAGDSLATLMGFFDPYMAAFVRPATWFAQAATLAAAAVAVLTVFSPWDTRAEPPILPQTRQPRSDRTRAVETWLRSVRRGRRRRPVPL